MRTEEPIDAAINWSPTFHMRPNSTLIVAVEVNEYLFPEILKIAAHDIEHYNFPIAVYQACPLDVYQNDARLARANLLADHGFGLITVDDAGTTRIHTRAEPLAQHIPKSRFDIALRPLTQRLKIRFRAAYATYHIDIGQGLQAAGQIIEAMITCIAKHAEANGVVPARTSNRGTADIIDALSPTNAFRNYRAALGGARHFANRYRNIASHNPRGPQEAAEKLRRCKEGFLEALHIAEELRAVMLQLGCPLRII